MLLASSSSSSVVTPPAGLASVTGLSIVSGALKQLGVLAAGETLSSEDAADGLERLNDWIDSLGIERLTLYRLLRTEHALTSGTASYTIGVDGDIDMPRPIWIERAGLVVGGYEREIKVLSDDRRAAVANKTQAGQVEGVYCDFAWSNGLATLSVYAVPEDGESTLVLYTPEALAEFPDLTTAFTFPPGYRRFFRTNLALELAPEYGRPIDPGLLKQAIDSKADIKRANHRESELVIDRALRGHGGSSRSAFLGDRW